MRKQITNKCLATIWTCQQICLEFSLRLVVLLCTFLLIVKGNAQEVDTARRLQKIDNLVTSIDQNQNLMEFIDEGQAIDKRTGKTLNDRYTTYFYHDATGKKLLKVYDNPVRGEAFTFTFYSCGDTLLFVKTANRREKTE